eukprot:jgi/Picre1/30664/NNA_006025.t1
MKTLRGCLDRTLRCYSPVSRVFSMELMGYQKKNGFVRQTGRVASSSSASSTVATTGGTLEELCWKNVLVDSLPEDPNRENRVRQVEGAMYTRVQPTGTGTEPSLIMASESVAELIGLHPDEFARPEFAMVFSGNATFQDAAAEGIAAFGTSFVSHYNGTMARKLGLKEYDAELTSSLWQLMYDSQADYTNTFRALGSMDLDKVLRDTCLPKQLKECLGACGKDEEWLAWLHGYNRVIQGQGIRAEERQQMQTMANPAIIPRNHVMVEIISQVEEGDYNALHEYMACLRNPYSDENIRDEWKEPAPPEPRLGVELLSCSS